MELYQSIARYFAAALALLVLELVYFRVARFYSIVDKPNARSSHLIPAIRGGGVIFLAAALIWYAWTGFQHTMTAAGLSAIAVISFLDDVVTLPARWRLIVQLSGTVLLVLTAAIGLPGWWLVPVCIVATGVMNAFNFMDGINGITGIYAAVTLITLRWGLPADMVSTDLALLCEVSLLATAVFLLFNFRGTAICFAGDVGSVTMAGIIVYLLLSYIMRTQNPAWLLLLLVYGIDSIGTILIRLSRRENIFKAHRSHLYQILCNERKLPHRTVAIVYGAVQAVVNVLAIAWFQHQAFVWTVVFTLITGVIYLAIRRMVSVHG